MMNNNIVPTFIGLALLSFSSFSFGVSGNTGHAAEVSSAKVQMHNGAAPHKGGTSSKQEGPKVPDPQCPIGSDPVGPMETATFSRPCKVGKGQDAANGTQICTSKFIHCMSEDPNGANHAYVEACGECKIDLTKPGQTSTSSGR
jgi:hypothetical protein